MRLVVGIGGNALSGGEQLDEAEDRSDDAIAERDVVDAVSALRPLADDHELVVMFGDGLPAGLHCAGGQDAGPGDRYPLDVLGVRAQAMIGYWLAQHLQGTARGRPAVCLLTRTVVDRHDPAFRDPAALVGPPYGLADALLVAAERGWQIRPDGDAWRRAVPSPLPQEIVETPYVVDLVRRGVTVVCAGAGGIPVVRDPRGEMHGTEAVVDGDLTAALLAREVDADALLLLTDVPAVERAFGTPEAVPIRSATVGELRSLGLPARSMGPKVEAACRFVEYTGRVAAIGALREAEAVLAGLAGTTVEPAALTAGPGGPVPPPEAAAGRARRRRTFAPNGREPAARP